MAKLNEYDVMVAGRKHRMLLSDEHAALYGDACTPAAAEEEAQPASKAAGQPANKSR